jgi:hypothetical protein
MIISKFQISIILIIIIIIINYKVLSVTFEMNINNEFNNEY